MSLHKSLKSGGRLSRRRNVLTRAERIARLVDEEKWDPERDSGFGLPKVKPISVATPSRVRAEKPAEASEQQEEGSGETAE